MALMSQRGRSFARSGSKSGWRRRRRNKAIRKGLGITGGVMLAIVLYVWSPWSAASDNSAPETQLAEPIASTDTATLDIADDGDPIAIPPSMPVAATSNDDALPDDDARTAPVETIAASNTPTPSQIEDREPVSLTMGQPLADASTTDDAVKNWFSI